MICWIQRSAFNDGGFGTVAASAPEIRDPAMHHLYHCWKRELCLLLQAHQILVLHRSMSLHYSRILRQILCPEAIRSCAIGIASVLCHSDDFVIIAGAIPASSRAMSNPTISPSAGPCPRNPGMFTHCASG